MWYNGLKDDKSKNLLGIHSKEMKKKSKEKKIKGKKKTW